MFVVRKAQIDAFAQAAVGDFEDRMVDHLGRTFPDESANLGERALRERIRLGLERSARYDITLEYDVCLYLHVMMALGPEFDEDPEHAWTRALLEEERGATSRVEELHDRVFGAETTDDASAAEGYQGH